MKTKSEYKEEIARYLDERADALDAIAKLTLNPITYESEVQLSMLAEQAYLSLVKVRSTRQEMKEKFSRKCTDAHHCAMCPTRQLDI